MDGPRDFHTKWSKIERERQIPLYHLYVEPNYIGPLIYETEAMANRHRKQIYSYHRETVWGVG